MSGKILVQLKSYTSLVIDTYSGINVANSTCVCVCEDMWRIQTACVEYVANTNLYHDHTGASLDKLT